MASKDVTTIISDVKVAIDEIAANDADFAGTQDNSEMDSIIESKIEEAVNFVHRNASLGLMSGDVLASVDVPVAENSDKGLITVVNCLRFINGKMHDWKYWVTETIEPEDEEYAIALDEYVGASVSRPAILALRFSSSDSNHKYDFTFLKTASTISGMLNYIPCGKITDGKISIDNGIYRAVIYQIAGLVEMTYNEERADSFFNMALVLMGIQTNSKQ